MKKLVSVLFIAVILIMCFALPVCAAERETTARTVEYLEDGSYFVIEVTQSTPKARSGETDGTKSITHYGPDETALWELDVYGRFTYNGVTSTATSATATVYRYAANVTTLRKYAYTTGNSAFAWASIEHEGNVKTQTVSLSCDKNGRLS